MKTRIFVTLLLSLVVALPAFTQQANSSSSAPQAAPAGQTAPASPSTDTVREPLQPMTSRDFWDGDDPNVLNLVLHPFARKEWVRRHIQPIKDRVNELDELTAANTGAIKDVDARAQQGIQLASEKTNLAEQHTADAANKAQMAKLAATSEKWWRGRTSTA